MSADIQRAILSGTIMSKLVFLQTKLLALVLLVANSETLPNAFQVLTGCPADAQESWSYRGQNGPMYWGQKYPDCNGRKQSPVAIVSRKAVKDENLEKLSLNNYDVPISEATIKNNGHTIQLSPQDDTERTITVDGDSYSLQQLHFHWGKTRAKGSEHTLDGVTYAMEMHLVHTNDDGGIAVVGIFFEEQKNPNEELQKIVSQLSDLKYKGTETELSSSLDLNKLLPANPTSYYRYDGSLTTPGCAEGVTWSVVPDPMSVGKQQMAEFRKLYSAPIEEAKEGCQLSGNYRPIQKLNNREVYASQ